MSTISFEKDVFSFQLAILPLHLTLLTSCTAAILLANQNLPQAFAAAGFVIAAAELIHGPVMTNEEFDLSELTHFENSFVSSSCFYGESTRASSLAIG